MGNLTGIKALGNYAGAANDAAAVDVLLNLLPDPDANPPREKAGGGMLDQMSPACLSQLRVELIALKDAVDTTNTL
jgi:hypothetical protein